MTDLFCGCLSPYCPLRGCREWRAPSARDPMPSNLFPHDDQRDRAGDPLAVPLHPNPLQPLKMGWVCPKCEAVMAPHIPQCFRCSGSP